MTVLTRSTAAATARVWRLTPTRSDVLLVSGATSDEATPDNPAWAVVALRHAADLAVEAADLRQRMAQGEGTPLRLVDFRKHMK